MGYSINNNCILNLCFVSIFFFGGGVGSESHILWWGVLLAGGVVRNWKKQRHVFCEWPKIRPTQPKFLQREIGTQVFIFLAWWVVPDKKHPVFKEEISAIRRGAGGIGVREGKIKGQKEIYPTFSHLLKTIFRVSFRKLLLAGGSKKKIFLFVQIPRYFYIFLEFSNAMSSF
jgi:hypothetical protein